MSSVKQKEQDEESDDEEFSSKESPKIENGFFDWSFLSMFHQEKHDDDDEYVSDNDDDDDDDDDDENTEYYAHKDDSTALYVFLLRKQWDKVIDRVQGGKNGASEARTWITRQQDTLTVIMLPIHVACALQAPLNVIEALIDAYPLGLQRTDDQKMLPLHVACKVGATTTPAVVRKLITAYPLAFYQTDNKGRTPVDLLTTKRNSSTLLERKNKDDLIDALFSSLTDIYPQGLLMKPDDQNMLPLHIACKYGVSEGVIRKLVQAYPDAINMKDFAGRTPLDVIQATEYNHRHDIADILYLWTEKMDCDTISSTKLNVINYDSSTHLLSDAPECSNCNTLLLKFLDPNTNNKEPTNDSFDFFCVTCKKGTPRVDKAIDQSAGSLYLVMNPFHGITSKTSFIREKIIECYYTMILEETVVAVDRAFNKAKVISYVYEGSDVHRIRKLFAATRKALVFVMLGERFCHDIVKSDSNRMATLEQTHSNKLKEIRETTENITATLKKLTNDIHHAKEQISLLGIQIIPLKNRFDECTVLKNNILESIKMSPDCLALKLELDEAEKTLKVAEAHYTLVHLEYQDYLNQLKIMETELQVSSPKMKIQLLAMKTQMSEATNQLRVDKQSINNRTKNVEPWLCRISKAIKLLKHHLGVMAKDVFTISKVMKDETDFMLSLCGLVVRLYQEFIPEPIDKLDRYKDEIEEIHSLSNTTPMDPDTLPILCFVDESLRKILNRGNDLNVEDEKELHASENRVELKAHPSSCIALSLPSLCGSGATFET